MAGPEAAAFDGTFVWIATQVNDSVTRIRVADGTAAGTFAVGKRPVPLLYAGGYLWVANLLSDNVMKLNSATGAVAGTYATVMAQVDWHLTNLVDIYTRGRLFASTAGLLVFEDWSLLFVDAARLRAWWLLAFFRPEDPLCTI